jgi:DNA-binding CsgD family transcriptional regulator
LRETLALNQEAREMGRGSEQSLHLARGIERIVGAAMTSIGVYGSFGPNRRGRIEENPITSDGPAAKIWAALHQRGTSLSPSLRAIANRTDGQRPVAARRRDLLHDQEWYRGAGDRPFAEEDRNLLAVFQEEFLRLRTAQEKKLEGPRLAGRQRDVLEALLRGASEKEVAWELGISRETVHTHVKSICLAYRTRSRAELLVRCLS